MRLKASVFACVTSIFEISAPKLTKVTYSHKFPSRVTSPPGLHNYLQSMEVPLYGCSSWSLKEIFQIVKFINIRKMLIFINSTRKGIPKGVIYLALPTRAGSQGYTELGPLKISSRQFLVILPLCPFP